MQLIAVTSSSPVRVANVTGDRRRRIRTRGFRAEAEGAAESDSAKVGPVVAEILRAYRLIQARIDATSLRSVDCVKSLGSTSEFGFKISNQAVRRSQAVTVLLINIAIVIGPTPPGTGVIAEHLGATASKSTSPTSR